jgi:hypothetical protein
VSTGSAKDLKWAPLASNSVITDRRCDSERANRYTITSGAPLAIIGSLRLEF